MVKVAVFALAATVVYLLLKRRTPEYSMFAEVFAAASVLLFVLPDMIGLMRFSQDFFDTAGIDRTYFASLLKIVGIALLTQFTADVCRDNAQSALASQTEFAGRILMLVCAVPIIRAVMQTASVFFAD